MRDGLRVCRGARWWWVGECALRDECDNFCVGEFAWTCGWWVRSWAWAWACVELHDATGKRKGACVYERMGD